MSQHLPPAVLADVGALLLVVSSASGIIPAIAALFGCVWYAVQLYDRFFGR